MTRKPECEYSVATHHSKDRVKVWCGHSEPVTLCGYHASEGWVSAALEAIRWDRDEMGLDHLRRDMATCGTCGRTWNDALVTGRTPTPAARCPFEYEHDQEGSQSD